MKKQNLKSLVTVLISTTVLMLGFQNCSNEVSFSNLPSKALNVGANDIDPTVPTDIEDPDDPILEVCEGISCDLTPITKKSAVVTILIALGDETSSQLVVNGASAQLIAENVVRYSSPVENPRILVVRDSNAGAEDPEDTLYAKNVLLARYNVAFMDEPAMGLQDSDVAGYDLIWFNNPGHQMGQVATRDTLLRFKGGVVIQGDDLAQGAGFQMDELTGLSFVDNGTNVVCNGVTYQHDNNFGEKYKVTLDAAKIPGVNDSTLSFEYGNDIDNTVVARADLEVLAVAVGGHSSCVEERPAIVRYLKN